jgi:hypothetical protein
MRQIGLALALGLVLAPLSAEAQQAEKVRRIGFLSGTNPNSEVDDALFRQILRCIQRPCDIRAAQAISLFGGPVPESPCKLKGLSHT